MATFTDKEFGDVVVRRSSMARSLKLSVAPNGSLRISMPRYAPLFLAKRMIGSSRESIRTILSERQAPTRYEGGERVGKSHSILVHPGPKLAVKRRGQIIEVTLPDAKNEHDPEVQSAIRAAVIQALQKEAKSYLPKRLAFLAERHDFSYSSVRFSHASSRWGSCSSRGVISLNIALMKLEFELIDYVLLHELAHTKQMNHSSAFWELVERSDPSYRQHRRLLKAQTPDL